jgi:hypothetical protein
VFGRALGPAPPPPPLTYVARGPMVMIPDVYGSGYMYVSIKVGLYGRPRKNFRDNISEKGEVDGPLRPAGLQADYWTDCESEDGFEKVLYLSTRLAGTGCYISCIYRPARRRLYYVVIWSNASLVILAT